jgi:hypothetical protein
VAQRGIAQTSGLQFCQLYDPACDVHARSSSRLSCSRGVRGRGTAAALQLIVRGFGFGHSRGRVTITAL